MKKKVLFIAALSALTLAACSHPVKKVSNSNSNQATFQKISHQKGHLSSKNLTPKMTASVITVYAAKKYQGTWNKALANAKENGLTVNLENRSDYAYMTQGTGYSYMISDDCGYTLTGDGEGAKFNIYGNKEKLATKTLSQMVDYLNNHDGEKLVKTLAKNTKIQTGQNSQSATDSSSHTKIVGDGGYYNVDSAMQGTWYTYLDNKLYTLTFSGHTLIYDGHSTELHKQTSAAQKYIDDAASAPKAYQKATQNWASVGMLHAHGTTWLNTRGWLQSAGDGEFYGVKTEKGQSVLITAAGAGIWTDAVYWRSQASAKQYQNKKFSDLYYQD